MKKKNSPAFTLIEMLVVISIIAVLAAFAVPAVLQGLTKGQMVGTMSNARQMYLAGQQMALDGTSNSDPNLSWPGDGSGVATLQDYCNRLVQNDYLKPADLPKLLSAPGAACTMTSTTDAQGVTTVTLGGKSGLKVYRVKDADAGNTVFAVSANYTYNSALNAANSPYGDKGFVVMRKGGDAVSLRRNNATVANYGNDASKFQSAVGKLTGDADGAATAGDGSGVLANP
jgi:prepilin-type N-terminal cleavage/methylation domain-containing protein